MKLETREAWLLAATDVMRRRLFAPIGETVPEIKVSVGFPAGSRKSGRRKKVGQYWPASATSDNIPQIFISPEVDQAIQALDVLVHELVHACRPNAGHGPKFKALATAVGLTGDMKATEAGPELKEKLEKLAAYLGEYPHAAINLKDAPKQTTRLIKVECYGPGCGYMAYTTRKWLTRNGAPLCPNVNCNFHKSELTVMQS
jgi:hypothetical protein